MDLEIDYNALERNLRANPAAVGPGVACVTCSAMVPNNYIFGKIVYHPAGRPCETVDLRSRMESTETSC